MYDDYISDRILADVPNGLSGTVSWQSPSNLAIIKYWGKYGNQLPQNPSISMSLQEACTNTILHYTSHENQNGVHLELFFDGQREETFEKKVKVWLESILNLFPFLSRLKIRIETANTFPHSAGIASSASAMSALALCLCSVENQIFSTLEDPKAFKQKASYVARLGSGSACRSVYGGWVTWGEHPSFPGTSNYHANPLNSIHNIFFGLQNSIIIVSRAEKKVSSSAGHGLMKNNPFGPVRFQQARGRYQTLRNILKTGDIEAFGTIAEEEAMSLHALMMCSSPYYLLLQPSSIKLIDLVQSFRGSTNIPVYFSFDAGPNMHLLYPEEFKEEVLDFLDKKVKKLLNSPHDIIHDKVGKGPREFKKTNNEN